MAKQRSAPAFSQDYLQHLHENAECIRRRVDANADEAVDAFAIANTYQAEVIYLDGFDPSEFSGMLQVKNGRPVVVLNRNQPDGRRNVTLIEELCHFHYSHPPEQFGELGREYNDAHESEAFHTAAAVLLPAVVVARAVYKGISPEEVAKQYGTSVELFEMRVKVLGLWKLFCKGEAA